MANGNSWNSAALGNASFTETTSGATETVTVQNTSNTASSQASVLVSCGGASAGDVWDQFSIGTTNSYAVGIDNSDSDKLKITTSASGTVNPSSATQLWNMTTGGVRTLPLHPMFKVVLTTTSANVTGNAATYYFGTGGGGVTSVVVDRNSNITSPSGNVTFTAPVAGLYYMLMNIQMDDLTAAMTTLDLAFEINGSSYVWGYDVNAASMRNGVDDFILAAPGILNLNAGDAVQFYINVRNGAGNTVSVRGSASTIDQSYVAGYLIG